MLLPEDRVAVKICGLTNREDARAAVAAGADFLGFNTWRGTKRFIDLEQHADWLAELPVTRVALLVNASLDEAARVAALPFVDALQFHGDEDAAYCAAAAALGKPILKALRTLGPTGLGGADGFSTKHLLLDAYVPGEFGGTGARVDLDVVKTFQARFPELTLWLAGGLTPENVAAAVAAIRPKVVDVSSGVEVEPGRKDAAKMRAFVTAARAQR
jgi:phosphoribosylanthranilate isomerase